MTDQTATNRTTTNPSVAPPDGEAAPIAGLPTLQPLRFARTDRLTVGYFEAGPSTGEVVLLLHGFPYDIHSYVEVIPRLVAAGRRVIVPTSAGTGPPVSWTVTRPDPASRPRSAATSWDCWMPWTFHAPCWPGSTGVVARPVWRPRCGRIGAPASCPSTAT